jgi:hypothetical protein
LYNFIRKYDAAPAIRGDAIGNDNNQVNSAIWNLSHRGGNATREAFQVRDAFKDYFSSETGSVSWQNQILINY